jgi:phosphate transport system permease protein
VASASGAAPGLFGGPLTQPSLLQRVAGGARRNEQRLWAWGGRLAALVPLLALAFTMAVLAWKSWPAIKVNGFHFFVGSSWRLGNTYGATVHTHGVAHPLGSSYGAWPVIAGTLQSSLIAVVIAVPVSLGAAFALTERIPRWLAEIVRFAIEILAGIPSVLIGLWGALTLGPILARDVYPVIARHMPDVPVLSYFRGNTGHGEGLLTSGIVLSLMIIPIIAATARNLFAQVPPLPKEGGEALGMTDWEVTRKVTIPWVRSGLIGATVLGLGRALGETIAVAMVSGSLLSTISPNIYGTMGTVAATIVTQLDSAFTDGTGFAVATLAELAVVLAVVSLIVNALARVVVNRTGHLAAPVGAGF